MEATSLVCVWAALLCYTQDAGSRYRFAQGTVQGSIGQRTLAWAENHLRYLVCGHTLQPLCYRLCSHDRNQMVWTDGGHSSSAPTGPQPLQAQIAFQQKRCAYGLPQQWPHLLAERWSHPFKTQSQMD